MTGGWRGDGDVRVEGSSTNSRRQRQAAVSLTPDADGMHIRIFESSKLEGSYVGDLPEPIDGCLGYCQCSAVTYGVAMTS